MLRRGPSFVGRVQAKNQLRTEPAYEVIFYQANCQDTDLLHMTLASVTQQQCDETFAKVSLMIVDVPDCDQHLRAFKREQDPMESVIVEAETETVNVTAVVQQSRYEIQVPNGRLEETRPFLFKEQSLVDAKGTWKPSTFDSSDVSTSLYGASSLAISLQDFCPKTEISGPGS